MRTIKSAVIGTGFIGPVHIEALKRIGTVDIVAVTSGEDEGAKIIAEKYGIPKVYGTWQDVIADKEVEVIHNCTPNFLHYEINKAALLAGKHVVSEKPLTLTSAESAELVKIAADKKLVNAVNYNYRFYPLIQQARLMVEKNDIGNIFLAHGYYLQDWLFYDTDYNWRLESKLSGSSRAVADIGSHWCDLIQFITGQKIIKVCANLTTVHNKRKKPAAKIETFKGKESEVSSEYEEIVIDTEDAGSIIIQFENGAQGVFTVSQVSAGRKNCFWFEIDGSKKAVAWNQEEPNQLWVGYREKGNEIIMKDPSLLYEEARRYTHYPGGHPEGYPDGPKNLFRNVYEFIREGKNPLMDKPDFPTFADADRENRIIEAIVESNKSQKWIEVR